ncbi:MAG: serine--tRNA ligase [Deltaproteobacteria bacterium]|nr:serine--tRNA ligase [Deltaproteobacteria bacterium]
MLDPARMDDVLRRGDAVRPLVEEWKTADKRRRDLQSSLDAMRAARNAANERMSKLDKKSPEFAAARDELRALSTQIKEGEAKETEAADESRAQLMVIPNAPHPSVPDGADEHSNAELHVWGTRPTFDFAPKAHWDLDHVGLDFDAGIRITGARFTVLRGWAAKLNRAIISYMLDLHSAHGFNEVWPPAVVRRTSLMGTGQLPKFEEDLFRLDIDDQGVLDNRMYLSPTAEVQVTNLHNDQILEAADLPLRYCAYAPCFRAEAGSAGKDTRGLIRQHQFDKVELVKITTPEQSYAEHESMREAAERVLQGLGLHYRVVTLCTGDMGFSAAKTYDIEVWLPGQGEGGAFREIASVSNCEDFQARRAKIRYRPAPGEKPRAVHTLNGSGLAVGRTLVAIVEQYQQADGSIVIPTALRSYLGGAERVPAKTAT